MRIHSILPETLTAAVDAVLCGVEHIAHGEGDILGAATAAAKDGVALIGPFRSADVAEVVEITAPAGLPLLAPTATWAGVTRMDEPVGDDDPSPHHGTVFRLVARDTEVARRLAAYVPRARVIAGDHSYGRQLDEQLAGLRRDEQAEVVVLAGLAGEPEIARAAATAPLPLIAFDGVQGADLGEREVRIALPFAPGSDFAERAAHAARLVLESGASERSGVLVALREQFDEHGDPIDPPVWLYTAGPDWKLSPDRPI